MMTWLQDRNLLKGDLCPYLITKPVMCHYTGVIAQVSLHRCHYTGVIIQCHYTGVITQVSLYSVITQVSLHRCHCTGVITQVSFFHILILFSTVTKVDQVTGFKPVP